jgi:hypothetical protein
MQPDLLHVLAREHQQDLLRQEQFRHRERAITASPSYGATPVRRARRSLGRAFVVVGTRLLGGAPATVELLTTRK